MPGDLLVEVNEKADEDAVIELSIEKSMTSNVGGNIKNRIPSYSSYTNTRLSTRKITMSEFPLRIRYRRKSRMLCP